MPSHPFLEEPSGTHPTMPVGEDTAATLRVPRGTLLMVISALGAALIGSGGMAAVLRAPPDHHEEVTAAVSEIKTQLSEMKAQIGTLNSVVINLAADLRTDSTEHKRVEEEVSDHEQRLRAIEKRMR